MDILRDLWSKLGRLSAGHLCRMRLGKNRVARVVQETVRVVVVLPRLHLVTAWTDKCVTILFDLCALIGRPVLTLTVNTQIKYFSNLEISIK